MKLKISDLKTERQWRAATGFDQARFEKLLALFTASYLHLYGKSVAHRQAEIEVTPSLTSVEELLFFTLFSLKAGLTYDLLGLGGRNGCRQCQKKPGTRSSRAGAGAGDNRLFTQGNRTIKGHSS
jgi:hypothetical protein